MPVNTLSTTRLVRHPAFVAADKHLLRCLDSSSRLGQIVFVIGMSGAGKTEIRMSAMRQYCGDPCRWGNGKIPAISVRASPSDKSYFSPKHLMTKLYREALAPSMDWMRSARDEATKEEAVVIERANRLHQAIGVEGIRMTEMDLRSKFEKIARARDIKAVLIDEAGSIAYERRARSPSDHAVNYMCLAEEVPFTLVMFGVPKIRALWQDNAEVRRRSRFVFVERYRRSSKNDRETFAKLCIQLSRSFAIDESLKASQYLEWAYLSSAGVFGELLGYFERADDRRVIASRPYIALEDLREAIYPDEELATLHRDAADFDEMCRAAHPGKATTSSP